MRNSRPFAVSEVRQHQQSKQLVDHDGTMKCTQYRVIAGCNTIIIICDQEGRATMPIVDAKKKVPSSAGTKKQSTSTRRASSATTTTTTNNNKKHASKSIQKAAPPRPTGTLTVAHLVSQLEGQMAHHTGYVPQDGVLMAVHASTAAPVAKGTILPQRRSFWSRCCLGGGGGGGGDSSKKNSGKMDKEESVAVRLLDESEW